MLGDDTNVGTSYLFFRMNPIFILEVHFMTFIVSRGSTWVLRINIQNVSKMGCEPSKGIFGSALRFQICICSCLIFFHYFCLNYITVFALTLLHSPARLKCVRASFSTALRTAVL
jgi:hypothetical protein